MCIRGSFRKIVKRGRKLMVKKAWEGGGITSLALTPHAVFTSCKGGKILARGGECPPFHALIHASYASIKCIQAAPEKVQTLHLLCLPSKTTFML